mmetsp:Transcript_26017/g.51027  ORF Transcript_26017/g.51027 Transcript_26017/m.51027 type:complete len:84 (-) Transcript_26017:561-812(-)
MTLDCHTRAKEGLPNLVLQFNVKGLFTQGLPALGLCPTSSFLSCFLLFSPREVNQEDSEREKARDGLLYFYTCETSLKRKRRR